MQTRNMVGWIRVELRKIHNEHITIKTQDQMSPPQPNQSMDLAAAGDCSPSPCSP